MAASRIDFSWLNPNATGTASSTDKNLSSRREVFMMSAFGQPQWLGLVLTSISNEPNQV
jgi:hypothetical protein